jgi:hypothetical protein
MGSCGYADAVLFHSSRNLAASHRAGGRLGRACPGAHHPEAAHDDVVQQRGWSVLGIWAERCEDRPSTRCARCSSRNVPGSKRFEREHADDVGPVAERPDAGREGLRIADGTGSGRPGIRHCRPPLSSTPRRASPWRGGWTRRARRTVGSCHLRELALPLCCTPAGPSGRAGRSSRR